MKSAAQINFKETSAYRNKVNCPKKDIDANVQTDTFQSGVLSQKQSSHFFC